MGARIFRIGVVCVRTCLILKDFWSGDVIGIRFFRLDGARSGAKSACPSGKSPEFRRQKAYVGDIALAVMLLPACSNRPLNSMLSQAVRSVR